MAQDTHLFSVSRPRQTLGQLNLNSALPQPSSALKRTSSASGLNAPSTGQHVRGQSGRMSMMPARPPPQPNFARASSGGVGGAGDPGRSVQRSRMSYAPGAATMTPHRGGGTTMALGGHTATGGMGFGAGQGAMQRRSSTWSQQRASAGPGANMGLGQQQSFFVQAPLPPGVPADKRRLRDRQVQNQMAGELEQYLTNNNFTGDMSHSLQPNAFRSPTQKDFVMIFQWLYKRIDPGYQFQKSIDNEVPAILAQLRYPFAKSITKSQLTAVGGQNWHTLLGMLHWLMQLAQMMDGFATSQYDYAVEEEGIDMSGDRIIFNFLSSAYSTWLECPEDVSEDEVDKLIAPHVDAMAREFETGNASYGDQLRILEAENESLLHEIEKEEESMPNIESQEKFRKDLDDDVDKFEVFKKKQQDKVRRNNERNTLLAEEIKKAEEQIEEALRDKADLQEAVNRQGISIQQIDQMNSEKERLQDDGEGVRQRLEETSARLKEKEHEASQKLGQLEALAREYNAQCYNVGIRDEDFELVVKTNDGGFSSSQLGSSRSGGDRLLADSETGYHPSRILNLDMRGKIKSHITGLRREVDRRRTTANEKDEENRRLLFDIASAIDDKKHEVDGLQHKVLSAEEEYEKTKDATSTQKLKSDTEIEKTEKELARMRSSLTDDIQYWQQREMNVEIEYEQLDLQADSLREELHTEVERMLDYVIKFKLNIQEKLETYETFIDEEISQELAQGQGSEDAVDKQIEMELGKIEEEDEEL